MTEAPIQLVSAEARAARARARLSETVAELRNRLDPKVLAHAAKREASDATNAAVRASADTVRRHPGATAGTVAVLGLFLVRRPIARLFRRKPNAARRATPAIYPPPVAPAPEPQVVTSSIKDPQ